MCIIPRVTVVSTLLLSICSTLLLVVVIITLPGVPRLRSPCRPCHDGFFFAHKKLLFATKCQTPSFLPRPSFFAHKSYPRAFFTPKRFQLFGHIPDVPNFPWLRYVPPRPPRAPPPSNPARPGRARPGTRQPSSAHWQPPPNPCPASPCSHLCTSPPAQPRLPLLPCDAGRLEIAPAQCAGPCRGKLILCPDPLFLCPETPPSLPRPPLLCPDPPLSLPS